MASLTPDFRFGNFVASIVWLLFVVLALVTVLILPIIFFTLFYIPLPVVEGEVLTPYLFFSMMVDPSRTLPILQFFLQYGQDGSFRGILAVQNFGSAIRPFNFRRFTFDRGADHLLDRDFPGRFERHG